MIRDALNAFLLGLWTVLRSPGLLVSMVVVTVVTALPFGLVLGAHLRTALSNQPAIDLDAQQIDAEWWMEYRSQASGLDATFTPTVIGFAAPLDNLSSLLDAAPRPWILAGPVLLYGLVWAFLLGGLLQRFDQLGPLRPRAFLTSGLRHLPRFTAIGALAGMCSLLLFLSVHRWLFGPVYDWLAAGASSEPAAFAWRVSLYVLFGIPLVTISLLADYSRVCIVSGGARTVREAVLGGARFVREQFAAVAILFLLGAVALGVVLLAYGIADHRFSGWRGVLLGQAYIVARIGIRLSSTAASVRLFQSRHGRG